MEKEEEARLFPKARETTAMEFIRPSFPEVSLYHGKEAEPTKTRLRISRRQDKLNETRRERFRPGIPPSPPPSLFLVPDNKARHFLPSSISRFLSHPLPFPFSLSSVRLCVPKQNFLTVCLGRSFLSLLAVSLLDCLCLRVWPGGGGEVRRGRSAKYVFTCAKLTGEKT